MAGSISEVSPHDSPPHQAGAGDEATQAHAAMDTDGSPRAAHASAPTRMVEQSVEDVARLERLLLERAHEADEQRREAARLKQLLREALASFDVAIQSASATGPALLREQCDRAVARALEAETAHAEAALQLDEALGLLHEARVGSAPADGGLDETCARLSGTARGLTSALAETEEARGVAEARLLLVEDDLKDARERALQLERELAETRELLEFKHVQLHTLQSRDALPKKDAPPEDALPKDALPKDVLPKDALPKDALRGELAGLRARGEESERALARVSPRLSELESELKATRKQLGLERAQLGAASAQEASAHARAEELETRLAQEVQARRESEQQSREFEAARLQLHDELMLARGENETLTQRLAEAIDTRQRGLESLEAQRDAAQRGTEEQRRRVESLRAALRETRDALEAAEQEVRSAARASAPDSRTTADLGETTQPGVPVHIEAIEALEERVSARDERITQLERQVSEAQQARAAAEGDHAGVVNKVSEKAAKLASNLEHASARLAAFEEVVRGLKTASAETALDRAQLAELFALIDPR